MGRTKKYIGREEQEGKNFQCIIYPDSESYNTELLLNRLSSFWDKFYYIEHDSDIYNEYDYDIYLGKNETEPDWKIGDLKKKHIHIVVHCDHNVLLGRAAIKLGISSNMVERCKSFKGSVQYLIHKNNPEKYQYTPDQIITNDSENLSKILKSDIDVTEKAKILIDYIYSEQNTSLYALSQFAIKNNCWDELRRGQHIYTMMINERNMNK